jgi:chromosome segregation ATPase
MSSKVFTKSNDFKSEYSCAVVRVGELTPIEGSDFLAKTLVQGTQIVVRKDQVNEGDIMIYAANETVLNQQFLSVNNLYEVGCREMNANKDEVAAIMAEYEPIKAEADKKRAEAKSIKGKMESYTKSSQKIQREIAKKKKKYDEAEDGSEIRGILANEINDLQTKSDEFVEKAMPLTVQYTNLKKEIEEIVKSGEHIVA